MRVSIEWNDGASLAVSGIAAEDIAEYVTAINGCEKPGPGESASWDSVNSRAVQSSLFANQPSKPTIPPVQQ